MKNYFCGHWGFNDTPEDTKVLMDGEGASESSLTCLRPRGFTKEDLGGCFPKNLVGGERGHL